MSNPTEPLAASAAGIKNPKASRAGLTGVFARLIDEHKRLRGLVQRVLHSTDGETRELLYPTLRRDLLVHEMAELRIVYHALEGHPETDHFSRLHAEDTGEIHAALANLDQLPLQSLQWSSAFAHLAKLVEAHFEQEEAQYFPQGQSVLGNSGSQALLERFDAQVLPG